jgi:hypothetical protein
MVKKEEKCFIEGCERKVFGSYSPDLDIKGLNFCVKHKDDVYHQYILFMMEGKEKFNKKRLDNKQ